MPQMHSVLLKTSHLVTTMTFSWFRYIYIDKYWQRPYCYATKKKKKNVIHCLCSTGLWWQGFKNNVSLTKVAHWLTPDIDIARTRVRESTAVDGIPVTNIAIKAWFMVHHRREVQGLGHKTVQLWEGPVETYIEVTLQSTSPAESLSARSRDWYRS